MKLINSLVLLARLTLSLAVVFLGACSVNPATGEQDLVLMSEDQELSLGRTSHVQILKKYGKYDNPELAAYVQRIGDRVAKSSHRANLIYRFTVLDSAEVNAFALPGGYIYVTRGILAHLNSEAELAAVLGHEIGHVTARHSVRQHSTATLTGIVGAILASQTGVQGAGNAANLLGTALIRGYGREHELEADRLGANYISNAGYPADAMLGVIRVLKNQANFEKELAKLEDREPRGYHGLFSTHPDNDKRLQTIIAASSKAAPNGMHASYNRDSYLKMIDGLTYAGNTREGVIRGQRFYHHDMDFTLKFPSGWRVKNLPHSVTATSTNNDGKIILSVQDRNRRISPKQFIQQRLGYTKLTSGESLTHNGRPGYTAITRTETTYGARLQRIIVLYYGTRAFIITGVSKRQATPHQYDPLFLQTGRSFRSLNANEKLLSNARKLAIIKFRGQPYVDLGQNSGLNHLAESQIRLLNGHYPSGQPRRGDLIKTIK